MWGRTKTKTKSKLRIISVIYTVATVFIFVLHPHAYNYGRWKDGRRYPLLMDERSRHCSEKVVVEVDDVMNLTCRVICHGE